MIAAKTTYAEWVAIANKAKEEAKEANQVRYIYFRSQYGWSISEFGGFYGDHYAMVFPNGNLSTNKTVRKNLGRLWERAS